MVQTVRTLHILAGEKKIIFEKPYSLQRIFFSIRVMARTDMWYPTYISFDDPLFRSFYMINGPEKYFEAEGANIYQGNIWGLNISDTELVYATTEILC